MIKLENKILQDFIERLIDALYEKNDAKNSIGDVETYDIPFVISSLLQSMKENEKYFHGFVVDLKLYPDYTITFDDNTSYNGIVDANINLVKFCEGYEDYPDYDYQIKFSFDERYYGYCQCTPDMPDYRSDKECCGHGCDAIFSEFELNKVFHIIKDAWKGDEHDYWNFEDEFYLDRLNIANNKIEEERKKEIEELKARIAADQKRLTELIGEKFPADINDELEKYKRTLDSMNKLGILGI